MKKILKLNNWISFKFKKETAMIDYKLNCSGNSQFNDEYPNKMNNNQIKEVKIKVLSLIFHYILIKYFNLLESILIQRKKRQLLLMKMLNKYYKDIF
jgi:hypothetical protein